MTTPLLALPGVRRLWVGETASAVGTAVSGVAMPLVALEVLDARVLVVTMLTAASWLPWLLVGLPAGALVDRLPKRPVLLACDAASVLLLLSVPLAAAAGVLTVAQLLVVSLGLGTASVFFRTAWTAYVPAVVPAPRLVGANALLHGGESAAQVAGPGLAGLLVSAIGAVGALLADAVSFAVSFTCLVRLRAPEPARTVRGRRLRSEVGEGVAFIRDDPVLRNLVTHGALSNLPLVGYGALAVPFLVRDVQQTPTAVGLVLAVGAVGGVLGASLSSRAVRALGIARALVLLKAGAAPCSLLLPFAAPGWRVGLYALGAALVGAGIVGGNVVSSAFRQAYVPPALLGRVMAASQVANLGTIPLGAVGAGLLAEQLGTRTAMGVCTAAFALTGLVLVLGPLRGRRDLPVRA